MPPPTLNPQGSRAGLITAVVILSILFVTSAVFAFYFSAENNKTAKTLEDRNKVLNQYASGDAQADPAVQALVDARTDPKWVGTGGGQLSAIQVSILQNKALQTQVNNLATQLAQAQTRVTNLQAETEQKTQQLDEASNKLKEEIASREKLTAEYTAKSDEQAKQIADALAQLEAKRGESEKTVTGVQTETTRALQASQAQVSAAQQKLTAADAKIVELQREIEVLKSRIPRPPKVGEPVIRQADGKIARVPGSDVVFIDLGTGDHISPGMTFEVYDRFSGVPGTASDDPNAVPDEKSLPKGKAAIEVVKPGPAQSECRIVRQTLGQPVVEGDVIANLVYDRNTKYNFVVFGDFDLDHNGTPTPADADVIKRLITQWGGKVQNDVTVATDFVVLGAVPEVPATVENEDPQSVIRREAAQKQLDAYNEVVSKAKGLNIPILNQNRFLYYVGYYELAQR
jgi:hypothetical protein